MTATSQHVADDARASRVRLDASGGIVVATGKVELGQGIETALRQIAADALGVAVRHVSICAGDTDLCPDEGVTAGSLSVETGGAALADACRQALQHDPALREACAELGKADTNACGRSVSRDDLFAKISTGGFIQDMTVPGMLHARVLRALTPHASLLALDRDAILAQPGVIEVLIEGDFVAIVAQHEWQAQAAWDVADRIARWKATRALPVLDDCRNAGHWLARQPATFMPVEAAAATRDADPQPDATVRRLDAVYTRPYLSHGSIGPSCALAAPSGGRLTIWTHSQGVFALHAQVARVLGIEPSTLRVVHVHGAGCYGHNGADDVALDAALIAHRTGRPVRIVWPRRDEFVHAPWGSAMHVALSAQVDTLGRIVGWQHRVRSQTHVRRPGFAGRINLLAARSIGADEPAPPEQDFPLPAGGAARNAIPLYDLPRCDVDVALVADTGLRTSAIRSLGAHGNVFAIESFMDEIALTLDVDPAAFRLDHLSDPRARAVLERLVTAGGWRHAATLSGDRGAGLAIARYKNSGAWCAVMVEIELRERILPRSIHAVVDCGRVINPDAARNQIEGGILQSLSWTLFEAVRWQADQVRTQGWDGYPILGFDDTPEVQVEFMHREDEPSLGVGECATGPAAAALANALARALGIRVRDMPLDPERIRAAIDAA